MLGKNIIQVSLDKDLVQRLLNGLYKGASGKALKVVISTDGNYHIESKELRMVIEVDAVKSGIAAIQIHNDKQCSVISARELEEMKLTSLGASVVKELREKYSPVFHSLADNIVVFSRAYGGN